MPKTMRADTLLPLICILAIVCYTYVEQAGIRPAGADGRYPASLTPDLDRKVALRRPVRQEAGWVEPLARLISAALWMKHTPADLEAPDQVHGEWLAVDPHYLLINEKLWQ